MISGDSDLNGRPALIVPQNASVQDHGYSGINIRTYIAIQAMQAILSRTDGGIFNPDDVADKACLQAEAMLRRMP